MAVHGKKTRRAEMNKQHDDYKIVPYPKLRRALALTLRSAQRKPMIHGLIDVDVTKAHAFLQEHKAKTGESLSFTAFISSLWRCACTQGTSSGSCHPS